MKRPVPPLIAWIILDVILFLCTPPAHSQTLPFFEDLPDLDFYAFSGDRTDKQDRFQVALTGQTGGYVDLGLERETAPGFFGQGRLMLDLDLAPTAFLRVDSTLAAPIESSSDDRGVSLLADGLMGRHRAWGRVGLGRLGEGSFGVDVDADYRLNHSGDGRGFAGPHVVPMGFAEQRLRLGLTLRRGLDSYAALVMPFHYGWRRVDYPRRPGGPPDSVTHELSSGFGFRDYTFAHVDGWLEIAGVTWARTAFGQTADCLPGDLVTNPGSTGCFEGLPGVGQDLDEWAPGGLNRLDLRLAHFDHMVGSPDRHVLLGGTFFFGSSWLWDESTGRHGVMFIGSYGLETVINAEENRVALGASISRNSGWTPGGEHIVAHHRAELALDWTHLELGMGFSHRSIFDWIAHPEIDADGTKNLPDAVPNHQIHTEWFFQLSSFQLGMYHQADYGAVRGTTSWDPWEQDRAWSHQLGVFLRLEELL